MTAPKDDKPRLHTLRRPLSSTLTAPAVRMVVVEAWYSSEEECGHHIYPVVALQSVITRRYRVSCRGWPKDSGTEKDLLVSGWVFDSQEEETTALIVDEEYGLIGFDDSLRVCSNTAQALVVCTWPLSEDEARLASICTEALTEAKAKQKRSSDHAQTTAKQ